MENKFFACGEAIENDKIQQYEISHNERSDICFCELHKNGKHIHPWCSNNHLFVSIDVGINHLGLTWSQVNESFETVTVVACKLVDLCNIKHKRVKKQDCKLKHSKGMYDRIQHFIQEYKWLFDNCCRVLIERQPIFGFTVVEQILLGARRNKSKLVSPNSMHCYFGINKYEDDVVVENGEIKVIKSKYEKRKEATVEIAQPYMTQSCIEKFNSYSRKQDLSDSVCLLLFHVSQLQQEYKLKQAKIRQREEFKKLHGVDTKTFLQKFRFKPYTNKN